jgi:hypothetical protein
MMNYQEMYERAVLHGMLVYNDMRAVGYLKPSNFKYKTGEVENSKIFEVFSKSLDYAYRLREFKHGGATVFSALSIDKAYMSDFPFGINTPKYCLLMLENLFKESIVNCLKRLSTDALYSEIVQNVYAEIELTKMDIFKLAENILAYFRKINFELGVLTFEELNENIDERVKQINQNYEIEMLTSRLKRHCDDANRKDYIGYIDSIKLGLTA